MEQKYLPNIVNELKKCDSYSRTSKFYDKTIKSKKIREIMKTMGAIKINTFSEFKVYQKDKRIVDSKPFNIQKIKNYLLKVDKDEKEKEIIKQKKLNNTVFKKLYRMTVLNIENNKKKHKYETPSLGTYNPNYDAIYKKPKATIIVDNKKDSIEKTIKTNKKYKIFKNKSGINVIKNLYINNIDNDNTKKFSTISSIKDMRDEKRKDTINSLLFTYKEKLKGKFPKVYRNKDENQNFNTINIFPLSTGRKKTNKIKSIINKNNLNTQYERQYKTSSNSIKNLHDNLTRSNSSTKNNIDIFNKTRTYYIDSYLESRKKPNIINKNNSKNKKKNFSHKVLFIKPEMPSIGYYNPNYDFIKENVPKICFLYHNMKKDDFSYKKNLLRKEITKYNINREYEIVKTLNN